MSPYSVSKAATEALCYQWSQTERFDIVTARPFTHIGPGQSARFAVSNFTKQISEILLDKREPVIRVGDLQTTRDFTDVRDVVRAYKFLLERGRSGQVYNVCLVMRPASGHC
jgi:GDP-4-dehydro-6-deoxy-D-mannose reductase